jgi:fumarate hydratase subunit beta
MIKNKAVYFGAIGGAGVVLSKAVTSEEVIAFSELGTEAVRKLTVEKFPAIVVIDSQGNNMYDIGREKFAR